MSNIGALKEGCGVGVVLIINGKPVSFKLALAQRKDDWSQEQKYEYGLISEDGSLYTSRGLYSGGTTGFGRDPDDGMYDAIKEGGIMKNGQRVESIMEFSQTEIVNMIIAKLEGLKGFKINKGTYNRQDPTAYYHMRGEVGMEYGFSTVKGDPEEGGGRVSKSGECEDRFERRNVGSGV